MGRNFIGLFVQLRPFLCWELVGKSKDSDKWINALQKGGGAMGSRERGDSRTEVAVNVWQMVKVQ